MRNSLFLFFTLYFGTSKLFAIPISTSSNTPGSGDLGTANKMCCTTTISSRQIDSGLSDSDPKMTLKKLASVLSSAFFQNSSDLPSSALFAQSDDLKTDQEKIGEFPADSLFAMNAPISKRDNYAIWTNTFSEWSSQGPLGNQPAFHYHICGLGAGINYLGFKSCAIGGGLLYDHVALKQDSGVENQAVNYALGTFYASFPIHRFSINLAATGGFLFTKTIRKIELPDFSATAIANILGYQLMPHVDLNYDFSIQNVSLSPFYQIDYALNISAPYKEHGAGAQNYRQEAFMTSILRQEVGMNFFETWDLKEKGLFVFRQKGSFVHLDVFVHGNPIGQFEGESIFFLPTDGGFQNFGSGAVEMRYQTKSMNFILTFEGFYGYGFINNAGYFTVSQGF